MPRGSSPEREHEYEELKAKFKESGRCKGREEQVAARIVNKQRQEYGETKADCPPRRDPEQALARTLAWWRGWSAQCTYTGIERPLVVRSLLTLKSLTYAPTGGIVAAPTTSPPNSSAAIARDEYW